MSLRIYQPSDLRRLAKRIPRYYPGWFSNRSSGGLASVSTDATLTGAGTPASHLGVAGWPLLFFNFPSPTAQGVGINANQLYIVGFSIPASVRFANLVVFIGTADAAHNSDVGLYNSAGTLVANAGAQAMAASGNITFPMVQGLQTIPPGLYFLAITSAASVITWNIASNVGCYFRSGSYSASVAGALPATIAPPAAAWDPYGPAFSLI